MLYGYTVAKIQVEDNIFWVAKSSDLKGCVGQGDTIEDAIRELETNEKEWIETAKECNIEIPKCTIIDNSQEYSGKFTLRISKDLHKKLARQAEINGVSINSYVEEAIAEKVSSVQDNQFNRMLTLLEKMCKVTNDSVKMATVVTTKSIESYYKGFENSWREPSLKTFERIGAKTWIQ